MPQGPIFEDFIVYIYIPGVHMVEPIDSRTAVFLLLLHDYFQVFY